MVKILFVFLSISLKGQLLFASQINPDPCFQKDILEKILLKELKNNTGALLSRIRRGRIGNNDIRNYAENYAKELKKAL